MIVRGYPGTVRVLNARVLTLGDGPRPRRGKGLADLGVLDVGCVTIQDGVIESVSRGYQRPPRQIMHADKGLVIDARGRVLMPAFVDCHTHACFAGSRCHEWEMKRRGATYLEILAAGGGIMSTVRSTREATLASLEHLLHRRLWLLHRAGTLTCEVKSGYGLTCEQELKLLRAIVNASETLAIERAEYVRAEQERGRLLRGRRIWARPRPLEVEAGMAIPSALLGHAMDPDRPRFVDETIEETLPAVHAEFPSITIDAFCEKGAWSLDDTVRLFERAKQLGHPIRVHADQFTSMGMVDEAIRLGARSVDHLEASSKETLERLAASRTFGVMLPLCGFHLDGRYADARTFVDAGGALCLASNYNPGSAPSFSMALVIAIAVRHLGLSVAEAIAACTINPASLLGLHDRGSIAPGQRGDLLLLRHTDERMLAYEVDAHPIDTVLAKGIVAPMSGKGYESARTERSARRTDLTPVGGSASIIRGTKPPP
jgi:imidazolonepropionase